MHERSLGSSKYYEEGSVNLMQLLFFYNSRIQTFRCITGLKSNGSSKDNQKTYYLEKLAIKSPATTLASSSEVSFVNEEPKAISDVDAI